VARKDFKDFKDFMADGGWRLAVCGKSAG